MAATINEICERIKANLDIADIIGERVQLKRSSRGYVGLCPFHNENTPSFHVYTDTQTYYCFGCKDAGDVFTFLQKIDHLEFRDVLKILADRAGINLPEYEKSSGEKSAYEIMDIVARFYQKNLPGIAKAYIDRRKLDASDAEKFTLGYAPASWDALVKHLRENGVTDSQMLDLGLAQKGKHYDTFRGRVIFPIKDITGKIIAFGGRLIDGEGAKYINSSDSKLFNKRRNLYLMNAARKAIHDKKRSILVEGYMDAIRLHKCGFTEAVASCGTSLTPEQASLLSRYADRCYICYDNDKAGQNAILRSMYVLAQNGLDVRVVKLFQGKDPDEFLSTNPPESFEELLKLARPLVLHHLEILTPAIQNQGTRKSALRELFASLSQLDVAEVLQYKLQLAEVTGVPPSKLEEYFSRKVTNKELTAMSTPQNNRQIEQPFEAALCSLMAKYSECRLALLNDRLLNIVHNPTAQLVIDGLLHNGVDQIRVWRDIGEFEVLSLLARGEEICSQLEEMSVMEKLQKVYRVLCARTVNGRIKYIMAKMQKSQATTQELLELQRLKTMRL